MLTRRMMTTPTKTDAFVTPATLNDAQRIFRLLSPVLRSANYTLTLYGSVLREGQGFDIDLMAVPTCFQPPVPFADLLNILKAAGAEIHHSYNGLTSDAAMLIYCKRLVDLRVSRG